MTPEKKLLKRSNRVLTMMSRCHGVLVRANKETALLHEICRLIVEEGNYTLAWVGYKEDDPEKSVRSVGEWGMDAGYVDKAKLTWSANDPDLGPIGTAIHTGRACVTSDVRADTSFAKSPGEGFLSVLALPLRRQSDTFGSLNVYAAAEDAFDADEISLLQDLADQLAFGVFAIRARERNERAERDLREANQGLEIAVEERTEHLREEIAQRARVENALKRANAAAQRAVTAKSKFLSSVSHELRTPLNAVIGFGQLLELDKKEDLTDQQGEAVDQIVANGQALLGMIDALIELSEADTKSGAQAPHPVDPVYVIADCIASVSQEAEQRNVTLTNQTDGKDLPSVYGDEGKIWRILTNILSNAIRYNSDPGTVSLSVEKRESVLRVLVRDSGIGIAQSDVPNVFEPFFRGSNTENVTGIGVGLSIARGMIEIIGGEIGVDSVEGEGSTFWFDLPLAEEDDFIDNMMK